LQAADAVINGRKLKLNEQRDYLDAWTNARDQAIWDFVPASSGKYKVEMNYFCSDQLAGSTFDINIGESNLSAPTVPSRIEKETPGKEIGTISVGQGLQTLTIQSIKLNKGPLMQLKSITLTPAN
jgi:hypothetical protein